MARLIFTPVSRRDVIKILRMLAEDAGPDTAVNYAGAFERRFARLAIYPAACALRAALGPDIRTTHVAPYIIVYRHDLADDTVTILRVIHGRRNITADYMRLS